jgi:hypothetical protein
VKLQVINVGGFGNTGCTAQSDFLAQFEGVAGALEDPERNKCVNLAPYQEFGILKSELSVGGLFVRRFRGLPDILTKQTLRASLLGEWNLESGPLSRTEELHLQKRFQVRIQYGDGYEELVDAMLALFPEKFDSISDSQLIKLICSAMRIYIEGLERLIFAANRVDETTKGPIRILGFKNDPPGCYPTLSLALNGGRSSAILRDPRDTSLDFARNANSFGLSLDSIKRHCKFFCQQLEWSEQQIRALGSKIEGVFFVHDFENFVLSTAHRDKFKSVMIGSAKKVRTYFDPDASSINIGIYEEMERWHLDVVEAECMEMYDNYRCFVRERGLLIE